MICVYKINSENERRLMLCNYYFHLLIFCIESFWFRQNILKNELKNKLKKIIVPKIWDSKFAVPKIWDNSLVSVYYIFNFNNFL